MEAHVCYRRREMLSHGVQKAYKRGTQVDIKVPSYEEMVPRLFVGCPDFCDFLVELITLLSATERPKCLPAALASQGLSV